MQESHSKQVMSVEEIKNELADLSKNKDNIIKAIESGVFKEHFFDRSTEIKTEEGILKSKLLLANQPQAFHITQISVQNALKRVA